MSTFARRSFLLVAFAAAAGTLAAQPAAGPAASAPGMGPRGGMGPRFGPGVTPGWSLMSPEERSAHRAAMQGMKSADECHAYVQKHHEDMAKRAQEKGQTLPGPRRDPCAGLKP